MISRNLALRLLIAAIFIPLLILLFDYGGLPFFLFVELLVVICLWEFFALTEVGLYFWQRLLLLIISLYPPLSFKYLDGAYLVEFVAAVIFITALPLGFVRKLGRISSAIGLSVFAVHYLSFGFGSLILIRESGLVIPELAGAWIIFLFATVWIVDTAAFYVGWQLGSTKLAPVVSPNKTVAGFIGGLAGAALSAGIFHFIFLDQVGFTRLILPGLAIAVFGQLGDLVESIFKREVGKKDSSNLIPGHGGALDRFDSILFAAPALYLYLKFINL